MKKSQEPVGKSTAANPNLITICESPDTTLPRDNSFNSTLAPDISHSNSNTTVTPRKVENILNVSTQKEGQKIIDYRLVDT